ncbi:amino acid adenylation domain-containing protein, partial [Dactylosporangium sp. NPDC049140]|uniref:amino acid adenylation domain-containing protein n=1 Tax=Dactylosporangium sp. NPDC049140 TaxID=3155647 RepID=UPI0033CD257E
MLPAVRGEQAAYVIYTSGSTGVPKGVVVPHTGVLNLAVQIAPKLGRVALQFASFSFDAAVIDLAGVLTVGGTLVMASAVERAEPRALAALIRSAGVTAASVVPSLLSQLDPGEVPGVGSWIVGSERVSGGLARSWSVGARVFNAYGPTEVSVLATTMDCAADAVGDPPIGGPLGNVQVYVLDAVLNPVPVGVPGEIFIGGVGLARGYVGRPELTAERFVAGPGGSRLYRSGDVARWRADGVLEFVGRADDQVKVRGFRVEPGEVEATLRAASSVADAVVVAEDGRLVAYVVPADGAMLVVEELRVWVGARLPEYMVPGVFVELAVLPRNRNGKVDRSALVGVQLPVGVEFVAPSGPVQEVLAGIWTTLLGVERIGVHDDFFSLGGHSLLATQVLSRVRVAFGVEVPVEALFDAPTIEGLAAAIADAAPGLTAPPIETVGRDVPLPLSFAQQRLWFLAQLEPDSVEYNMPILIPVPGHVDVAGALRRLVERHEVLRTRLVAGADGVPYQVIEPAGPVDLPVVDGSVEEWLAGDARVPFDLAAAPPLRATLLRVAPGEQVLALAMHHVIGDEWSDGILRRELAALYDGDDLAPLPVQYADFAAWQRRWLTGDALGGQLDYWRRRLDGAAALELPTDRPRPAQRDTAGDLVRFRLPAETVEGLRAAARGAGASMYMAMLGLFTVLLHRWSGQDDIVVGTPVANRNRAETEGLIGFFVNTLVLRTSVAGDPTFTELLGRVRAASLGAYANQDVPFERLVDELVTDRDRSRTPLFQVLFNYMAAGELTGEPDSGVPGSPVLPIKFDLSLTLGEAAGGGAEGALLYSTALWDRATIERMVGSLLELAAAAAGTAGRHVSELPVLSPAEERRITARACAGTPEIPVNGVHVWIAEQARLRPDATAVTAGGDALTYAELEARANRLARRLVAAGVGPDTVVGLCLPRGADMAVAPLAVWKAGGAYLPLDPDYPAERLEYMLRDSGATVLVGEGPAYAGLEVVTLDDAVLARYDDGPLDRVHDPRQLAYVIYTSGSTGRPKGVAVPHGNLVRLLTAARRWFTFGPSDVWTLFHSFAFDFSVWELWGALAHGGRLVVVPWAVTRGPAEFLQLVSDEQVTVLSQTPSAFAAFMAADEQRPGLPLALRYVVFGGEALDPGRLAPWYAAHPGVGAEGLGGTPLLVNMYGITETTVHVSYLGLDPVTAAQAHGSVIGVGLPDLSVHVLDRSLRPVPDGVPGELFVGGAGLARGYVGRAALTAERFVADPLAGDGSRLYRTGDVARRLADGGLEYLGRADDQVKIRGFRIEPGEIEAALRAHEGVRDAVVLAAGERLVAYVVPAGDEVPAVAELRARLGARLPEYMVPSVFMEVTSMPMNRNGKVDRAALPAPDGRQLAAGGDYTAPNGPVQELLAGVWAELLGVERVGAGDNFFALGGHSLLATQVASRVRAVLGAELPVSALFDAPTLAGLAAVVDGLSRGAAAAPITPVDRDRPLPLSFAQQRLWFLAQLDPGSAEYTLPMPIRLRGDDLSPEAMRRALEALVARHEALRTRLVAGEDGVPYQVIDPPAPFELSIVDLSGDDEPFAAADEWLAADAATPFDLAAGPVFRASLLRLAPDEHVLALAMHHVAGDEWSARILDRDLDAFYDAACAETEPALPPLPVQYADFAVWQRGWLTGDVLDAQLGYWRERLAGLPELDLPTDRPRRPVRSTAGAVVEFTVPDDVTAGLRTLSRSAGASMFMTVLGAFEVLLGRYCGQDDIVVGTPVAGRNRAETEGLIGFFVNTLVLRTDLSGDPTFTELLARVRAGTLEAYANQDVPFEQLVDELGAARDRSRTPLFQVLFNYARIDGAVRDQREETLTVPAIYDLTMNIGETEAGLIGWVEYSSELFDEATARRLIGHLITLLRAAAETPQLPLSELPMMTDEEQDGLDDWADTVPASVPAVIAAAAAATPDAVAVRAGHDRLTFAELDDRAARFAGRLRDRGVGPESVVGLQLPRGVDLVVAMLGVWKAGGAYLPLDPEYPAERLEYMIADAGVQVVIDAVDTGAVPFTAPVHPYQAACVIYTSGSTGRPKGTVVPHDALLGVFDGWAASHFTAADRLSWLTLASAGFDVFTGDLVRALAAGGTLVIGDVGAQLDTAAWHELLTTARVEAFESAPRYVDELVEHVERTGHPLPDLRLVVVTTDVWRLESAARARRVLGPRTRILTAYGVTEATVDSTYCDLTDRVGATGQAPIGGPLPGVRLHVLNRNLRPVPLGVAGELYIGGAALTRGYLDRPALTGERFVADPFTADGSRLYRTGDRVRRMRGGLEFLGRADDQLKVRGYRIEPGEVEYTLTQHPAIDTAVVVADELDRLVAYLMPAVPPVEQLRAFLGDRLPAHLIPAVFVELDGLPLTPNGKVDRGALAGRRAQAGNEFVAPRTAVEDLLAGIWGELLGVPRVGVHDDFFALGGHSLLATQVVSRVRRTIGAEIPVAAVFDAPTVARLAAVVDGPRPVTVAPAIEPADRTQPLPLSFAQQRLWFLDQLDPGSAEYNAPMPVRFRGPLDTEALRAAVEALVARHEVLRTRLVAGPDGVPQQVVDPPAPVALPLVDLAGAADPQAAADAWLDADAATPFDLAAEPLFRATLLRLGPDEHVLAIAMHHVVADEWSEEILDRELDALYDAARTGTEPRLAPLPVQYADFAVWQRRWLTGDVLGGQVGYWRDRLADAPVLELPADRPRPAQRSSAGASLEFVVPAAVADGLRAASRGAAVSMFMTVFAAFNVLLGRYAGQDDIVVGTPIANRNRAEIEGLIGFFVNTLVLRTDLSGDPTFAELLGRVRAETLAGFAHQDVPFEQLVDELGVARDRSRTPLFQVLFNYATGSGDLPAARPGAVALPAKFDLSMTVFEFPAGLIGSVQYSTALFDEARMARLIGHFQQLLAAVSADIGRHVSDLPILTEREQDELAGWNDTTSALPAVETVAELIADRVRAEPGAVAVRCGEATLTYGELWRRSADLAGYLLGVGVGTESVVGLCLGRGVDFVTAVLAVWRAGAAYLPLDPDYPAERLAFMAADGGASVVLAQRAVAADVGMAVTWLDDLDLPAHPGELPAVGGAQAAYVIYTSGSTGVPKGVVVAHASLVNLVTELGPVLGAERAVLQFASFGFDAAVLDLAAVLSCGGTLVIATAADRAEPRALARLVDAAEVRSASVVPSLLAQLDPDEVAGVDTWVLGAERLSAQLAARWAGRVRLVNTYGPTEATVMATVGPAITDAEAAPPIGAPLGNVRVQVLDRHLNPVPVGVPGEVFIGGVGVARGYAGRPDLTAERFVADPVAADGSRLYRSGDVARWRADGQLEFVGRADTQVKVRGFRVEPGEVEAALRAHGGIRDAAVIAGDGRLVAYVVPAGAEAPTADVLRGWLGGRLPQYMVPSVFVELTALPLNRNGKLDRGALPAPDGRQLAAGGAYVAPDGPVQELLAGVWSELLGVERVGAGDDFFSLGGHSLLATQLVSRIRAVLGVEVPVAAVFDAPTVAGLGSLLSTDLLETGAPAIGLADRGRPLPLSYAQQRLWFLAQLEPGSAEYNTPLAIHLGAADPAAVARALTALVTRHETLRTRLVADADGVPHQVVDAPAPFDLPVVDLTAEPDPAAAARAWQAADALVPFDLATGPLFRATLLRLAPDEHILAVATHHVVSDEWSAGILRDEFDALHADPGATLRALPVQYADFAAWQRNWLTGAALEHRLAYWRDHLAGAPTLELPTDHPRPPVRSSTGAALEFAIPAEVADGLHAASAAAGATMFMTVLSAFTTLLGRYTGQRDIVVGAPIANRNRAEIEGLIGFFVNSLVLRTDLSGDPTFAELLGRVRTETLSGYAHQDVPFEQLVDALGGPRDRSRTPLFQVLFNYARLDGVASAPVDEPVPAPAIYDLGLVVTESGGGLTGSIEYSTQLFEESTIRRLIRHLNVVLAAVAAAPDARLSSLPMLTVAEDRALRAWNANGVTVPSVGGVHELLPASSSAVAVRAGDVSLTFAELDARAARFAGWLAAQGVGAESVVGLQLPRGVDLVVAMLGVWKAGAAYLALDPSYPVERLEFMVADAGVSVVVSEVEYGDPFTATVHPAQAACVIYTSGSTGTPKGTVVPHSALLGVFAGWSAAQFTGHSWLTLASASFDVFTGDVVRALAAGGTLVIGDVGAQLDTATWHELLTTARVEAFESAPRYVDELVSYVERTGLGLPDLRLVVVTTDVWRLESVARAQRVLGVRVLTAYGVTEASVDSTFCELFDEGEGPAPIGGPLPGVELQVLDAVLRPVPLGVAGELFLGGVGVSRGYLGQASLTASRFVAAPGGSRWYRTGDRVRRTAAGLEFLGRADEQMKVRGYRIEPGEVEFALTRHPSIDAAVVVADDLDRLVAFVVPAVPPVEELRAFVGSRLPSYMVPAVFMGLDVLPLTPNGKVDRGALAGVRAEVDGFVAP